MSGYSPPPPPPKIKRPPRRTVYDSLPKWFIDRLTPEATNILLQTGYKPNESSPSFMAKMGDYAGIYEPRTDTIYSPMPNPPEIVPMHESMHAIGFRSGVDFSGLANSMTGTERDQAAGAYGGTWLDNLRYQIQRKGLLRINNRAGGEDLPMMLQNWNFDPSRLSVGAQKRVAKIFKPEAMRQKITSLAELERASRVTEKRPLWAAQDWQPATSEDLKIRYAPPPPPIDTNKWRIMRGT